ncbi:LemA family protein [Methanobacterium petrolearium]|uniref:LemA family protein n=1 Tax=Methanobacterium petrolearium TaxID=710190 RepID=UPI001AE5952A|nr:LemA family protein [Methanobacterium petrolearium]MBP1946719.1 LemA protein [Methanobacterium petrolearium]BDZ70967.1 LemA family protein [Methanobacterium petrolearium]
MWNLIGFGVVVLIIIIFFAIIIGIYNSLVKLQNGVEGAWSQINVQLERRSDLIKNLVETVKGYATHEKTTFQEVSEARSDLKNAETVKENEKADNALKGTLKSLFAVAENYPELKADENFLELQDQLSETEDKIAKYREFYNEVVLTYNNKREVFPNNIVSNFFKFQEAEFFEHEDYAEEVPEVDF